MARGRGRWAVRGGGWPGGRSRLEFEAAALQQSHPGPAPLAPWHRHCDSHANPGGRATGAAESESRWALQNLACTQTDSLRPGRRRREAARGPPDSRTGIRRRAAPGRRCQAEGQPVRARTVTFQSSLAISSQIAVPSLAPAGPVVRLRLGSESESFGHRDGVTDLARRRRECCSGAHASAAQAPPNQLDRLLQSPRPQSGSGCRLGAKKPAFKFWPAPQRNLEY